MERRRAKRKKVNLKAERISCIENCSVFIEDISESGISMITAPSKKNDTFVPGSDLDLELTLSSGDAINLNCNVKWSFSNGPEEKSNTVGLEIVSPPAKFKEFLKNLR